MVCQSFSVVSETDCAEAQFVREMRVALNLQDSSRWLFKLFMSLEKRMETSNRLQFDPTLMVQTV